MHRETASGTREFPPAQRGDALPRGGAPWADSAHGDDVGFRIARSLAPRCVHDRFPRVVPDQLRPEANRTGSRHSGCDSSPVTSGAKSSSIAWSRSSQDSKPTCPPVVADQYKPGKCRCPRYAGNPRTGSPASNTTVAASASGRRYSPPASAPANVEFTQPRRCRICQPSQLHAGHCPELLGLRQILWDETPHVGDFDLQGQPELSPSPASSSEEGRSRRRAPSRRSA